MTDIAVAEFSAHQHPAQFLSLSENTQINNISDYSVGPSCRHITLYDRCHIMAARVIQ